MIRGNHFKPNETGGKTHSWISSSSTNWSDHVSIIDNVFGPCFDHAIYCAGLVKSVVANNTCRDTGGPPIKIVGNENVVTNNTVYAAHVGGIETRNGSRNIIANNTIYDFVAIAIDVTPYGGGWGGVYTDNTIEGNFMRGGPGRDEYGVWFETYPGIMVYGEDISGTRIINNTMINTTRETSVGAITVSSLTTPSYNVTISGNTIEHSYGHGIYLNNIKDSLVSDNIIDIIPGKTHILELGTSSNNLITDDNLMSTWSVPISVDPIALWTFNEASGDALDSSGYESAATAVNMGSTARADEGSHRYATLDGINDYFVVDSINPAAAKLNLDNVSVIAWIRYASTSDLPTYSSGHYTSIGKGTTRYCLNISGGRMSAYANDASNLFYAEQNIFDAGWWQMLAMTYDGTTLTHYRALPNYPLGPLAASTTCNGNPLKDSAIHDFVIGAIVGSGGSPTVNPDYLFKGDINEVRVYNRALDSDEVQTIMTNGPVTIP